MEYTKDESVRSGVVHLTSDVEQVTLFGKTYEVKLEVTDNRRNYMDRRTRNVTNRIYAFNNTIDAPKFEGQWMVWDEENETHIETPEHKEYSKKVRENSKQIIEALASLFELEFEALKPVDGSLTHFKMVGEGKGREFQIHLAEVGYFSEREAAAKAAREERQARDEAAREKAIAAFKKMREEFGITEAILTVDGRKFPCRVVQGEATIESK